MSIGQQLRQIRKKYSLTQQQLAEQGGVSFAFVNRVETGKTTPRLEELNRVLALLGCEIAIIDKKTKKVIEI